MSITSITFRRNTLIIKFNDIMQSLGKHSITEKNNYLIKETIPIEAIMTPINDCKWIKVTVSLDSPILPFLADDNYTIKVGYVALKKIRYVETACGNIYSPCIVKK